MVGKIKRWLGIDRLEQENEARADEILVLTARIAAVALENTKTLTAEPVRAKIEPKPTVKRANWGTFRNAMEKSTEPEREST
jgi:hypothetical protein